MLYCLHPLNEFCDIIIIVIIKIILVLEYLSTDAIVGDIL